jgi:large subunit ribosomal protein L13
MRLAERVHGTKNGTEAGFCCMKTTYTKKEDVERQFLLIDAEGLVLGRLAARAATVLRGKHKPTFEPSVDTGDYVIVINADKIRLTGKKDRQKVYYRHTQYPGGLITTSYKDMMTKSPERVIRMAVAGMLPHNTLGRQMIKKLKIYSGENHPHVAQKPVKVSI